MFRLFIFMLSRYQKINLIGIGLLKQNKISEMKIVFFLLLPVFFSHLSNAQLSNESLKELSSEAFEKFFQQYKNSSDFISPAHFQSFLPVVVPGTK